MAIFICSQCGHTEETPDELIGRTARCLSCQTVGTIESKSSETRPSPPVPPPAPAARQTQDVQPPLDFLEMDAPETKATQPVSPEARSLKVLITLIAVMLGFQVLSFIINNPFSTQWEYKIVSPDDLEIVDDLNLLGTQGWEVVTARRASGYGNSYSYEMILKRSK